MQLYEQTKPQDQQVIAAVKKRNRTKFRWGTNSSSYSTKSGSSITAIPHASSSKKSTGSSSNSPPPSSNPPAGTRSSSNISSGGRRSQSRRPPRLKPTLAPIVESELEDHVTDDEEEAEMSPASSSGSSLSLPAGSKHSFSSSDASFTRHSTNSTTSSLPEDDRERKDSLKHQQSRYKLRVEYNLRKLLRQVMGLGGAWSCDQQVARHYACIKWEVVRTQADGNCLFRAISDQLYGSEVFHGDIRRRIVEFIQREGKLFRPFIATEEASAETLEQYCKRMKREGEWGGNPELYAAAKLFNVHIVVHQGPMRRVRIENGRDNDPKIGKPHVPYKVLHLLYKDDHYNSLRPPPVEDEVVVKEKARKLKGSPKQKSKHYEELVTAIVVKRDRSPVNSPQNSHHQAKTYKIQDKGSQKAQGLGGDSQVGDKEAQVSETAEPQGSPEETEKVVAVQIEEQEQPVVVVPLGTEFQAAFEEASVSVAVRKPTRVTFRRGKAHSTCSSDGGSEASTSSSSSSVSSASSSPSEPSVPVCPPRKQSIAEPPNATTSSETSMLLVAKAAVIDTVEPVLLADEEEPSSARVAFPNRLKFHQGVQQQQKRKQQQRTHQPMTATC